MQDANKILIFIALAFGVNPAFAQAAASDSDQASSRLELICVGGGSANKPTVTNAHGNSNYSGSYHGSNGEFGTVNGSGSANATVYGQRSQEFADQVRLFLEGDHGRLRMPRTMLPAIRGGDNGWFKLKNIKYSENEIRASVAVNPLNNPKMRIDRYTGAISLSGKAGDFVGQCQRAKLEPSEKQF